MTDTPFKSDRLNSLSKGIHSLLIVANGHYDDSLLDMLLAACHSETEKLEITLAFYDKSHPIWNGIEAVTSATNEVESSAERWFGWFASLAVVVFWLWAFGII